MKKKAEKIVNIALNVLIGIFSIVLLISIYNTIQLKIFKNSYSNFFGYSVFEIQTNSMAEEIFADDWIIVKITKNVDVKDIITFDNGGKFITHRVVEKFNETFVTQGDANNSKDEPIDSSQIVGKVVKILPNFGVYRKTLFDTEVLLALIGLLCIFSFLFKKDNKKEIEDNEEEKCDLEEQANIYSFYEDEKKEKLFSKIKKVKEENNFQEELKKEEEINNTFKKEETKIEKEENETSKITVELDEENIIREEENKLYNNSSILASELDNLEFETESEKELEAINNLNKINELEADSKISIDLDLDDAKINSNIEPLVLEEKEVVNEIEEVENNYDEEIDNNHDISIITVEIEPLAKIEIPKEKKKTVIEEDIYKEVDQEIILNIEEPEIIKQENEIDAITVYQDEIDRTRKEIELYKEKLMAINEQKGNIDLNIKLENDAKIKKEQDRINKEKEDALEAKKLTHISLENLNKRKKKCKNIIDRIILTKENKLDKFIALMTEGRELQSNEPTIIEALENAYNDVLYYNEFEFVNNKKLDYQLNEKANKLINDYKGNDKKYASKVNNILECLLLIGKLETTNLSKKTTKEKNDFYKNELTKYSKNKEWSKEMIPYIISEYKKIQKNYFEDLETVMKNLETKTFNLDLKELSNNKNMYAVNLEHNVEFDKFYSDFIIDETYKSGVIKEDKMNVVITLLMTELVKDMLLGQFKKKYLLYLPETLYDKKTKLTTMIKSIEDKYAKTNIIITLNYKNFIKTRKIIREFKKEGYNFGVYIEPNDVIKENHKKLLGLVDYIFIDKEENDLIIKKIPSDYYERIIFENITTKLDDYEIRGEV